MARRKQVDLDRGVSIRTYASGERKLQVQFSIMIPSISTEKKTPCKEVLTNRDPDDPDDRDYANHLRGMIMDDIRSGDFDYAKYFPTSPKAQISENRGKNLRVKDIAQKLRETELRNKSDPDAKAFVRQKYKPWIDTKIGNLIISELREHHITTYIEAQTVKLKTIRDRLSGLRKIVKKALANKLMDHDPFEMLEVKEHVTAEQLTEDEEDVPPDPFTVDEINTILESAGILYGPLMKNFIQFEFYTGLRPSEMFALKWEKVTINDTKQTIEVKGVIVKGTYKPKNKTKFSTRTVILTQKAIDALNDQKGLTSDREDGHVWIRPDEYGPFNSSENLRERWKLILKHAGVRYRVPYQMRHTFASNLLSGGENIHFVAKMLGHATIEMCMNTYAQWIDEDSQFDQHNFVSKFGQ